MSVKTYNNELHEATLAVRKNEPGLSYQEACLKAARILESKQAASHAPATQEKEDWRKEYDNRFESIKRISEVRGISFEQAAEEYEHQSFSSGPEVVIPNGAKPTRALSTSSAPAGTLPGMPVLRCVGTDKEGKLLYAPFPS